MDALIGFAAGAIFWVPVGMWLRKYWGKKDPTTLAAADAAVKEAGERAQRRF